MQQVLFLKLNCVVWPVRSGVAKTLEVCEGNCILRRNYLQAELEAFLTGVNFKAIMLKSEVNDLMEKRQECGFNDHVPFGQHLEIKIPNTSIVKPHNATGEIKLMELRMVGGIGNMTQRRLQTSS